MGIEGTAPRKQAHEATNERHGVFRVRTRGFLGSNRSSSGGERRAKDGRTI